MGCKASLASVEMEDERKMVSNQSKLNKWISNIFAKKLQKDVICKKLFPHQSKIQKSQIIAVDFVFSFIFQIRYWYYSKFRKWSIIFFENTE